MFISKRSRKLLKAAVSSKPGAQDLYSGPDLAKARKICSEGEALLILQALKEQGLISIPYASRPDLFSLTEMGLAYEEFCFHVSVDFFKRSVLCPIVVTILTEAVIHGGPILLKLMLQLV